MTPQEKETQTLLLLRKAVYSQAARYIVQSKWLLENNLMGDLHRVHQSWIAFCNQLPFDMQNAAKAIWFNEFVR